MARLILLRVAQIPVVLLAVSVIMFWLIQVVPGNPGRNALGPYATQAQVALWDQQNGLTGPVWSRYLHWLGGFVTGHWGTSFVYHVPSLPLILGHLWNSSLLGLYAFALLVPPAMVLGSIQAYREGRRTDRAITVSLMAISALPEFVIGILLLVLLIVGLHLTPLQTEPTAGVNIVQRLQAMTLPAVVLALSFLAVVTRMVRTGASGAMAAPYHRTAVLKGLHPREVVSRHVLRNALVPTLPLLGLYLGGLLGGSAIVETLFNYPGLGALLVVAAERKDISLLTNSVMLTGAISLITLLAADLALIMMDPRIRFHAGPNR